MLGGGWGWGGGEGAEFWEQLFSVSGLLLQAEPPLISEQQGQTAAAAWGLNVHFLFVVQRTSSKKKKKKSWTHSGFCILSLDVLEESAVPRLLDELEGICIWHG